MTVKELFEHFSAIDFHEIVYFDKTNNIKDSFRLIDWKGADNSEEYFNFMRTYDSFKVIDWRFDNYNNKMIIDIKEEKLCDERPCNVCEHRSKVKLAPPRRN